jgi:hypothetical protein
MPICLVSIWPSNVLFGKLMFVKTDMAVPFWWAVPVAG